MRTIPTSRTTGFTLIELIITMLVISILTVFATSRLDLGVIREEGFTRQASTAIRFAQKLAIGTGCSVRVQLDSNGCNLTWNVCSAASGNPIPNAASGLDNFCENSSATVSPSADFSFDNIGRPVNSSNTDILLTTQTFTVGSKDIRVEAETGYTHEL